ncbi:hypothetical protein K0M31_012751 [Melipona bicolor]|uniref:Uncharacterized protein n=1 Tax=Melipona bicolor TaxID=60889 RepID=A0AA40FJI6_9HYME|nr:hypothetical protein K0M31_012751 [Melipona bicolor]
MELVISEWTNKHPQSSDVSDEDVVVLRSRRLNTKPSGCGFVKRYAKQPVKLLPSSKVNADP